MSAKNVEQLRDAAMERLIEDLRPLVEDIDGEAVKATRNNYHRYMELFSRFADGASEAHTLANALIAAGGNEQGIMDALQVSI